MRKRIHQHNALPLLRLQAGLHRARTSPESLDNLGGFTYRRPSARHVGCLPTAREETRIAPHPAAHEPERMLDRWDDPFSELPAMNVVATFPRAVRLLSGLVLCALAPLAIAQVPQSTNAALPLSVTAAGNHAAILIGAASTPIAEVSLDFQDASGLTPASLAASAKIVDPSDPLLLARLPSTTLTTLPGSLPMMLTIEPPTNGGLSFRGTGRMEIHTHALPYSVGSFFRVFKAPLGGAFQDVTDEIAQGSVRARTTYGGFSQFLILVDLRSTSTVVSDKISGLRTKVAALPSSERGSLEADLDRAENAVTAGDFAVAIEAIDAFRGRVNERAGTFIPNEWRATRDVDNQAGQLIAGANSLRFSVAYLRDFGQ
jgi:hypothetical protein